MFKYINCSLCYSVQSIVFVLTAFLFVGLFAASLSAASPGALDLSFGSRGLVTFDNMPGVSFPRIKDTDAQADGKIIAVGTGSICNPSCGSSDILVTRFNLDGTYDTGFGTNGSLVYDYFGQDEGAYSVKMQSDGKIIVAGGVYAATSAPDILGFKILRLMPDGTLDSSFGTNGFVYESFNDTGGTPDEIFIQSNGKIVVSGVVNEPFGTANYKLFIARFNANGSKDSSLGTDGTFTKTSTSRFKVGIQSDNKIITVNSQTGSTTEIRRYNTDGTLDNSFGSSGVKTFTFGTYVSSVAVQSDDKILVGGFNLPASPKFKRFNADGSDDVGFVASNGELRGNSSNCFNCTERIYKIETLPDGRFYTAGTSSDTLSTVAWVSVFAEKAVCVCLILFNQYQPILQSNLTEK